MKKMSLSAVIVWKCNLISNLISHHWHRCQGRTVHESQPAATAWGRKRQWETNRKRERFYVCIEVDVSTLYNNTLPWDVHVNTEKHTKQMSQILISYYEKDVGLVRKRVNSLMIAGGKNDIESLCVLCCVQLISVG